MTQADNEVELRHKIEVLEQIIEAQFQYIKVMGRTFDLLKEAAIVRGRLKSVG